MNKITFEQRIRDLESESYAVCERLLSKKIVILPAGRAHRLAIVELSHFDIWADFLADKNPKTSRGGTGCWSFHDRQYTAEQTDQVIARYGNTVNYMITSRPFWTEIKNYLLESGINNENIFSAPTRMGALVPGTSFKRRFEIWRSFDEIMKSADLLEDDVSRMELWDLLSVFCVNAPVWHETEPSEEYFNTPYLSLGENEVFVDAGMYDGMTSRRFAKLCPTYKYIYGIEANPQNMDQIYRNLEGYRDVHIKNNALCNSEMMLKFSAKGVGIEGARLLEKGEMEVKGIRGDSLNIAPTFIKLDVEGAEYDALMGFQHTIRKYRPKMAVSVYHSLEDHWRLIQTVKDICPDYCLYLKHHYGYEDLYGTILYAEVKESTGGKIRERKE